MSHDRILIFDTTLRDGEQSPGCSMTTKEKLEVADALARLGVDIIEAGFPISSQGDFEAVQAIAETVGQRDRGEGMDPVTIAGLARTREGDIVRCGEAVRGAKKGRIHTFIATSPIHMARKLRMEPPKVLQTAVECVALAKTFTQDVEFSCEDAGRSDIGFMVEIVSAVIDAGATTINLPDTVGYCQPDEYAEIFRQVIARVPNAKRAIFSTHCHDDLGNAVANSIAGVRAGARQIECTINGIGERAGNASLEEVVMNFKTRQHYFNADTRVRASEIYRVSRLVQKITGSRVQANKAIVGANAFAHESGIHQDGMLKDKSTYEIMTPESVGWTGENLVMGKHSGRNAFRSRLVALGFSVSDEELNQAFERFKALCDKKKAVYDEDLYAIVDETIAKGQERWELQYLHVSTGTDTIPTATVKLRHGKDELVGTGTGDGPVDAAINAIESLAGVDVDLESYHLDAVTSGQDAQGRVTVVIKRGNRSVKAHGTDTDTIVASGKAFVNALNTLTLQEAHKAEQRTAVGATI